MIRKFSKNEKKIEPMTRCPKCDIGSKRLCDTNPLSNETFFTSSFVYFEFPDEVTGKMKQTKTCSNCGYNEEIFIDNIDDIIKRTLK